MKPPFGECTQAFLHHHPDKRLWWKGSRALSPRTLFQRTTSAPTLGAAPAMPQPRPGALRGRPGDPAASVAAWLSQARSATWWPRRALRAGLPLHVGGGENRSPRAKVNVGYHGLLVSCRMGTKQPWDRTDLPEVSSYPIAFRLCELEEVSERLSGDISATCRDAREH